MQFILELKTAAEINRMEKDGCNVVGMPEAGLAKELEMDYAAISVIANWAAGKTEGEITMADIEHNLHAGMANTVLLLKLDVQVFKLRKTVGKRVRESVLQFDVFQQYVDEPACAVYKNFCH